MNFTHYAFSDDSSHTAGRYNSLAMVSLKESNKNELTESLSNLFLESGIFDEFKWEKLKNAKYRLAAEKIIHFTFQNESKLRIDIITWDLEDRRHKGVKKRDDSENLVRMYYHLACSTLSKKWPISDSCWKWHPDEQSSVHWDTLRDCLITKKHPCTSDLFNQNPSFERVDLRSVAPSKSNEHPLIQVADLFAGMSAYSFGHNTKYKEWKSQNSSQLSMFGTTVQKFSNSENERFQIIEKFDQMTKERSLQIGLESTNGLNSFNPKCFINFWLYEPQHELDKAPSKQ